MDSFKIVFNIIGVYLNQDKISWYCLSSNPAAIHLLEQQIKQDSDKINWGNLSLNHAAIHLIKQQIKQNQDKINWGWLSANPAIFELKSPY